MKVLFFVGLIILSVSMLGHCDTLVKYNVNTGDIIQTNDVSKMPSEEILNDRFRSETMDVLLVKEKVDISKQKVSLNLKGIVDISKGEIDLRKRVNDEKKIEYDMIEEKVRKLAIDELKKEGKTFKYYE